ncbi:MAG TPA: ABC-F family ATP-binding cassette domain-containing protein [Candidatus Kapabacteria bacterium]|nr:ABC-F family ATP-binding cassette domain-containing protein [Candidatus Kapabacteria bacterium]
MIAAQNLGISFGGDVLFEGVSFLINPGDRIGLVGSNGAGKSTLMKALMGRQVLDEGRVATSRHAVIGYLPQEGIVLSDKSVREEVMLAFGEIVELEREIDAMHEELSRRSVESGTPEYQSLIDDLGELQHRFEAMNGFSAVGEVDKVLGGLGFEPTDLERNCGEFSGGWQMRIELAKLLLRQPDLLMLDEPTNHLDIESLTWIESFLQRYQGGLLLISHDRSFLDGITNRTFELSMGRLSTYTGNYSSYLRQRGDRRAVQQAAYENQQKQIAETERFIERFRYKATKASQVQSRVKALERLDRVAPLESDEASVHFKFPPAPRSGRTVVELTGVSKRYGTNLVLDTVDFALERGEKVAFLGRNGEGKSTLSRIIAGIESYEGTRALGHNVSVGYYAQHQAEDLDPRMTVLETLDAVATGDVRTKLRTLLGAFLFNGDDVFKRVSVLSGGEKSRLALAKMLLEPVNLVILDEPTNHLDMASKGVLKEALAAFDGALIIVSHDRDFLGGLVEKCIEFRARRLKVHLGGIEEYLAQRQITSVDQAFARSTVEGDSRSAVGADDAGNRREQKRLEAELRNRRYAATKELRKKIARTEEEIAKLEESKTAAEEDLARPEIYSNPEKSRTTQTRLRELERTLAERYATWEELAAEIDTIEKELA